MHDLAIFGAGGLGREVLMLVHQINQTEQEWNPIGFFDDRDLTDQKIAGFPYLGNTLALQNWNQPLWLAVAIGNPLAKRNLVEKLYNPLVKFPVLCHPDSAPFPEQEVNLAEGAIVCRGVVFTHNISIGRHVLLNLACTIGHDAQLSDFCSLMPGVRISGETVLDEAVYLGTNASVLNQIKIGKETIIGAGAVVTQNIPAHVTAVGVPARIIKNNS